MIGGKRKGFKGKTLNLNEKLDKDLDEYWIKSGDKEIGNYIAF
jgi:hypothetical protein